jgi:hypothetical protein
LKPARANSLRDPISKKKPKSHHHHKRKGLVEWFKVEALSSSPRTAKKQKTKPKTRQKGCTQWNPGWPQFTKLHISKTKLFLLCHISPSPLSFSGCW